MIFARRLSSPASILLYISLNSGRLLVLRARLLLAMYISIA